jgi:hypothetical protein
MKNPGSKLSELQFTILDGLADDYEDVEQLYLYANRELSERNRKISSSLACWFKYVFLCANPSTRLAGC